MAIPPASLDAIAPVANSFATGGPEWQMRGVEPAAQQGQGFGSMLVDQVSKLDQMQTEAAQGAQSLATGTSDDPSSVVMSIERARLAMQLASQVRGKLVEAYQDIFHTQV